MNKNNLYQRLQSTGIVEILHNTDKCRCQMDIKLIYKVLVNHLSKYERMFSFLYDVTTVIVLLCLRSMIFFFLNFLNSCIYLSNLT